VVNNTCPVCQSGAKYLFEKNAYRVFKCRACGLGFISPLPTEAQLTDFYNMSNYYCLAENRGYADYSSLEEASKKMYRDFLKDPHLSGRFDFSNKTILDVGCAFGYFLDVAREAGARELWGTDITSESEKVISRKGYISVRGAFENIVLPENHFDFVFMGDVFEHLLDPFAAAKKVSRIMKRGGFVLITTVNFDSLFARSAGKRWRLMVPPEHIFYWTARAIQTVFHENRFEGGCKSYTVFLPREYFIERFKKQFGFHPPLSRLLPFRFIPVYSFDTMKCLFRKT